MASLEVDLECRCYRLLLRVSSEAALSFERLLNVGCTLS